MCSGRAKLKFDLNFLNCFVHLALLQGSKCLIIEVTCGNGHIINSSVVYQVQLLYFFGQWVNPRLNLILKESIKRYWCITKKLALDMRVKASNSWVRILIFSSFCFIVFLSSFFLSIFAFLT
jgi:hypothetical protein